MMKLARVLSARLGLARNQEFEKLFRDKIARRGLSRRDFAALAAMDLDEFLSTLGNVASGEGARYSSLRSRVAGTDAIATSIGADMGGSEFLLQRLLSDQLIQFLLMQKLARLPDDELVRFADIRGRGLLPPSGGAMLVGSHFGPARLVPLLLALRGTELTAIAPIDFQDLLGIEPPASLRMLELTRNPAVRVLAEAQRDLRAGRLVHSTGDGLRGGAQIERDFLGSRRSFPTSYAVLAASAGVPCHPVFVRSDTEGRLHIEVEEALGEEIDDGPAQQRLEALTGDYVRRLENRWRSDFGNVPLHSLKLMRNGWQKASRPVEKPRKGPGGWFRKGREGISRRERWNRRWSKSDYSPFWLAADVPQALRALVAEGVFRPGMRLLEIGCGQGENAFYAAQQGLVVTAVDFSEAAIRRARAKHDQAGLELEFRTIDFAQAGVLEGRFDGAFDCGCLHAIPASQRAAYVRNLAEALVDGAPFLLLHKLEQNQGRQALERIVLETFDPGFTVISVSDADLGTEERSQPAAAILMRWKAA